MLCSVFVCVNTLGIIMMVCIVYADTYMPTNTVTVFEKKLNHISNIPIDNDKEAITILKTNLKL